MGGIDGCILLGNVLLELTIEIILGSTSLRFASGPVYENLFMLTLREKHLLYSSS